MTDFDYGASAALYTARGYGRKTPLVFRRFETAADAIRHAVEELPSDTALVYIETDDCRIDRARLRELYDSPEFPISRAGG